MTVLLLKKGLRTTSCATSLLDMVYALNLRFDHQGRKCKLLPLLFKIFTLKQ